MPGGLGRLPPPPRLEGRSSQASLSPGTTCSGTGHPGLALPVATDGRSCARAPWCSQEPTATPWIARHPRNAHSLRDLPRNFPLPTSPSRLPAHLSDLWDKVPTSAPWTPGPQVPWSPASPSLSYHLSLPKEALSTRDQHPNPAGSLVLTCLFVSPADLNLRTMPSKMPLKGDSQQQALQRQPLVSGSLRPSTQG